METSAKDNLALAAGGSDGSGESETIGESEADDDSDGEGPHLIRRASSTDNQASHIESSEDGNASKQTRPSLQKKRSRPRSPSTPGGSSGYAAAAQQAPNASSTSGADTALSSDGSSDHAASRSKDTSLSPTSGANASLLSGGPGGSSGNVPESTCAKGRLAKPCVEELPSVHETITSLLEKVGYCYLPSEFWTSCALDLGIAYVHLEENQRQTLQSSVEIAVKNAVEPVLVPCLGNEINIVNCGVLDTTLDPFVRSFHADNVTGDKFVFLLYLQDGWSVRIVPEEYYGGKKTRVEGQITSVNGRELTKKQKQAILSRFGVLKDGSLESFDDVAIKRPAGEALLLRGDMIWSFPAMDVSDTPFFLYAIISGAKKKNCISLVHPVNVIALEEGVNSEGAKKVMIKHKKDVWRSKQLTKLCSTVKDRTLRQKVLAGVPKDDLFAVPSHSTFG